MIRRAWNACRDGDEHPAVALVGFLGLILGTLFAFDILAWMLEGGL